mmetsp:Transcript_16316/g.36709  ORF Transcript_16316/g.36709 Transcript_16316/m.36709 type:complete len:90 (-) Transcript_16316:52-321(-)
MLLSYLLWKIDIFYLLMVLSSFYSVQSISDILSYANNPGVDLPKKIRGRKMSEGLQCIFSLISASTVLYNNFPDVSQKFVSSQLDRKIK